MAFRTLWFFICWCLMLGEHVFANNLAKVHFILKIALILLLCNLICECCFFMAYFLIKMGTGTCSIRWLHFNITNFVVTTFTSFLWFGIDSSGVRVGRDWATAHGVWENGAPQVGYFKGCSHCFLTDHLRL